MRSSRLLAAVAVAFALLFPPRAGATLQDTADIELEIRAGHLTLRARVAPIEAVVDRLARATGISFRLGVPADELVTVELSDVALDEGIRRLLSRWNTMFLYDRSTGALSAVHILGPHARSVTAAVSDVVPVETGALRAAPEPAGDSEEDRLQADLLRTTQKIEALEAELRRFSPDSPEGLRILQEALDDPHSSVRIIALQWLAGREETKIVGLPKALMDSDSLVQTVAQQILLDRGVDEDAIEQVRRAAEAADEQTVKQLLNMVLTQ